MTGYQLQRQTGPLLVPVSRVKQFLLIQRNAYSPGTITCKGGKGASESAIMSTGNTAPLCQDPIPLQTTTVEG